MGEVMIDCLLDGLLDTLKILPYLLITFLLLEYLEHKLTKQNEKVLTKAKKGGPILGGLLGGLPQCGFSSMAASLFSSRVITMGTLIAVFLSTSDEMIPILIAEKAPIGLLIKILVIKLIVGMISGIIIDALLKKKEKTDYHICSDEHCHCEDNKLFLAAFKHTINIFIFILICTFVIDLIMKYGGSSLLNKLFLKNNIFGPFLTSLIGLIPNCAASVVITELYLKKAISFAALISGLLTGAGIGLLVLFRTNKNKKENLFIVLSVYLIGALVGVLTEIIIRLF